MRMKVLHSKKSLCTCCMEEHEVKVVRVMEHTNFKNVYVDYEATYFYCENADEFFADESMIRENDKSIKDAYRERQGLLTSQEIIDIRSKYGITQSDFCLLLGWGGKTITRYESHQIQDKAHDMILKKLDRDPEWFVTLLEGVKSNLSTEVYERYLNIATALYEKSRDNYLRKAIHAGYVKYQDNQMYHGNAELALDKVVDVIRYFAASVKVRNLYKVKLMKLMWYGDMLSYKKRSHAITGLVYQALPMGAVPIAHDSIIDLKGVPCEEVDMGETSAYHFVLKEAVEYVSLSDEDKGILDVVIDKLGSMSKSEIVDFMHKERAYIETMPRDIISFKYASSLRI